MLAVPEGKESDMITIKLKKNTSEIGDFLKNSLRSMEYRKQRRILKEIREKINNSRK